MNSSSPAEKAYEVASGGSEEKDSFLGSVGKDNSIFVAALKEHLQHGLGSLEDAVQSLFSATAKGTMSDASELHKAFAVALH